LRGGLSKNFTWRCQYTTRENKKREGERRNNNSIRKEIEEIEETENIDVNEYRRIS